MLCGRTSIRPDYVDTVPLTPPPQSLHFRSGQADVRVLLRAESCPRGSSDHHTTLLSGEDAIIPPPNGAHELLFMFFSNFVSVYFYLFFWPTTAVSPRSQEQENLRSPPRIYPTFPERTWRNITSGTAWNHLPVILMKTGARKQPRLSEISYWLCAAVRTFCDALRSVAPHYVIT